MEITLNPAKKKFTKRISIIARMQWKTLCPLSDAKSINNREIDYKILRAIALGKVTHKYGGGIRISRYWCLDVMHDGKKVLAIWKYHPKPNCIKTSTKKNYDKTFKAKYMAGSYPKGTNPPVEKIQVPLVFGLGC